MKRERFAYLIPRDGAAIPVPEDRFARMPVAGMRVRMNPYWDHLVIDGAVLVGADPRVVASSEPAPAPKASKDRS